MMKFQTVLKVSSLIALFATNSAMAMDEKDKEIAPRIQTRMHRGNDLIGDTGRIEDVYYLGQDPAKESIYRNQYWQYITNFKEQHGYFPSSHYEVVSKLLDIFKKEEK